MNESIRIALVEDDLPFRRSLQLLIDGSPGFRCVGDWATVETALPQPMLGFADVLLLDLQLPGMPGDEAVGLFLEKHPSLLVLIFTAYDDEERVFSSLCRGACGYLLKSMKPERLLEAIREAIAGGSPMSPTIARKVVSHFRKTTTDPATDNPLTERELQLLSQLAEGHSYQSAADKLYVSANTVRSHVRSIYEKLQVHNKAEAVNKAVRSGLL